MQLVIRPKIAVRLVDYVPCYKALTARTIHLPKFDSLWVDQE